MHTYRRKVHYYETDRMQVVHHSNYIRWMEEARIEALDALGVSYVEMEAKGIISPVLSVECHYRSMSRFGETIRVETKLTEVTRVSYRLSYRIYDEATGELRADGTSSHCFINEKGRPISLAKKEPELYESVCKAVEPE